MASSTLLAFAVLAQACLRLHWIPRWSFAFVYRPWSLSPARPTALAFVSLGLPLWAFVSIGILVCDLSFCAGSFTFVSFSTFLSARGASFSASKVCYISFGFSIPGILCLLVHYWRLVCDSTLDLGLIAIASTTNRLC
jgi:hypothetical protein